MARPIELVVGLGNPEASHALTRHNAGFWFLDGLAGRHRVELRRASRFFGDMGELRLGERRLRLLKPTTYMNRSGQAVAAVANYFRYESDSILIVHDEIDLPPGTVRLKSGGGTGGHRGLEDIVPRLGTKKFTRMRLGVGHPGSAAEVIDYVLRRARSEEQTLIDDAIARALDRFEQIAAGDLEGAMNVLHRKDAPESDQES